jgi:1D-myo-inositol-tetrakisphosphate 5-kinase/inositol-polyphosphate multikinase
MKLSEEDYAKPLVGQVGGVSHHKKPLLTLSPDYVLKPLLLDHRGIREIAFYEAIRILSQNPINATYSTFLTGGKKKQSAVFRFGEAFDTLALALAIFMKDNAVAESEGAIQAAWRAVKREIEMIRRLANFTAPYYGVMGQRGISAAAESRFGVKEGAHLLLHDLTKNYSKPCVMDLKMGTQSYEPDAPADKRLRESSKYPQQATFGFRIVGMRMYVPDHLDADTKGYRHFGKSYGRSLSKREDLLDAMRLFFSSGTFGTSTERDSATKTNGETTSTEEKVRTRVLSTILQQLRPLRRWFEENKSLRFYASSLLIVYEGDVSKEFGSRDIATIKMIDFGRVRRVSGIDNGYNTGLHELKHLFTDVLVEEQERQRPPKVASADSAVL